MNLIFQVLTFSTKLYLITFFYILRYQVPLDHQDPVHDTIALNHLSKPWHIVLESPDPCIGRHIWSVLHCRLTVSDELALERFPFDRQFLEINLHIKRQKWK